MIPGVDAGAGPAGRGEAVVTAGGKPLPLGPSTVVDEGLYYIADGVKIPLRTRTDQIAVRFRELPTEGIASTDAATAVLTGDGGPLEGFEVERTIEPTLLVLSDPSATGASVATDAAALDVTLAEVARRSEVAWVAPVFVDTTSGTSIVVNDEVIVQAGPGVDIDTVAAGYRNVAGVRRLAGTPDQFILTVAGGAGERSLALALELDRDARLGWTTPNFYAEHTLATTTDDPLLADQWHLENTGGVGGVADADVDAQAAWDINPGGSSDVVVAVVDDGMEFTHPDLAPNLFVNPGEVAANSIDDDGNGWVDDVNGWDFTSTGGGDNNPGPSSIADRHATSVAGVIAAKGNNALGVAGMAYTSTLLPVRIFNGASATSDANIASAIYYAAGRTLDGTGTWNAAHITNNSWGGGAPNTAVTAAFTWAATSGRGGLGVPSFIATGNNYSTVTYPASLSTSVSGVIAVGASTNADLRSSYSNIGAAVDVVAPSSGGTASITTTDRVGAAGYNTAAGAAGDYTNTFASGFGGTSSATPLTAGIGALLLAQDPTLTAAQVKSILRNTTDLIGEVNYTNGFHPEYGYGRVNAATALAGLGGPEVDLTSESVQLPDGSGIDTYEAPIGQALTRTYRIRNQGTDDLTLSNLSVTAGPFAITTGLGDTTLSLGESTTFQVTFTPTSSAEVDRTLTFTTNDNDETTYNVSLFGRGQVSSVSGTVFEDWDGDGVRDTVTTGPRPSVTLFDDRNGNDSLDAPTPVGATPEASIPDDSPTGATSTAVVSGRLGTIVDVDVTTTITHRYPIDLLVRLTSPSGQVVTLFNGAAAGGTGNLPGTVFDDEASTSIAAASQPFNGRYRPVTPLSELDGEDPNGTWTVQAWDLYPSDVGTLNSWSVTITTTHDEIATTSDASGNYGFLDLIVGDHSIRQVVPTGWNATGPTGGSHDVTTADPDTAVGGKDFGQARQNAIYGHYYGDTDASGAKDGAETGAPNWTAYIDANDNGSLDAINETLSISPALAIPDYPAAAATSTQTFSPSAAVTLDDLDVEISITHVWVADLLVTLTSPAGTTVTLVNRRGGGGDNFTGTVFDDEATSSITTVSSSQAPFTGRFRPESPLSAFDGQSPAGTWTLSVKDQASSDAGTLVNWKLTFKGGEAYAVSDVVGNVVITDVPPGTHRVRQVPKAGFVRTEPVAPYYDVALTSGNTSHVAVFGNNRDDSVPTVTIDQAVGQNDPTLGSPIVFDVAFSENVTGFGDQPTDVDLSASTVGGTLAASVTGGPKNYTVSVTGMSGSGTVVATVPAGAAKDAADNLSTASTSTDNSVTFSRPTVSVGGPTVNVGEGAGTASVPVTLSQALNGPTTVTYHTTDGTASSGDYTGSASGTVVIPTGETTANIQVAVNPDDLIEGDQDFSVVLDSATTDATGPSVAAVGTTVALGVDTSTKVTIVDDDTTTITVTDDSVVEGSPGDTVTAGVHVTLTKAFESHNLQVTVATADGSAVAPGDYTAATAEVLTVPAGAVVSNDLSVGITSDDTPEPTESFTVGVSSHDAPSSAMVTGTNSGTVTIDDDQAVPVVSIGSVAALEGDSGTSVMSFLVSIRHPVATAVNINWATSNGTATAGSDYVAASGVLTIPAGATFGVVDVSVKGDTTQEPNETFTVTLSGYPAWFGVSQTSAVGAILNDDGPRSVAVNDAEAGESAGTMRFTITLSDPMTVPVTVSHATAAGSASAPADFTSASSSVTFAAGETAKTVDITIAPDAVVEVDETFTMTVGLVSPPAGVVVGRANGTGTIRDDDAATVSVAQVTSNPIPEGAAGTTVQVRYRFTLSAPAGFPVEVTYNTDDSDPLSATAGSDYVAKSGTVTFSPGQTSKDVLVTVNGDNVDEPDETFQLLSTLSGTPAGVTDTLTTLTTTIADDDTGPVLRVGSVSIAEGNAGTKSVTVPITLSAASSTPVTATVTTSNGTATAGSDYQAATRTVTIPAGQRNGSVSFTIVGDTTVEPNETFSVTASAVTGASLGTPTGTVTITNDDAAAAGLTVTVSDVSITEGNTGTTRVQVTVSLNRANNRTSPVTVQFTTSNGSAIAPGDYRARTGTVTFNPGVRTQKVWVDIVGDTVREPNETFVLQLLNPSSGLSLATKSAATVTILNND